MKAEKAKPNPGEARRASKWSVHSQRWQSYLQCIVSLSYQERGWKWQTGMPIRMKGMGYVLLLMGDPMLLALERNLRTISSVEGSTVWTAPLEHCNEQTGNWMGMGKWSGKKKLYVYNIVITVMNIINFYFRTHFLIISDHPNYSLCFPHYLWVFVTVRFLFPL